MKIDITIEELNKLETMKECFEFIEKLKKEINDNQKRIDFNNKYFPISDYIEPFRTKYGKK